MDKFLKRKTDPDDRRDKGYGKIKRCRCDSEYIAYGFTAVGTNGDQPVCVVLIANTVQHRNETCKVQTPFNNNASGCSQ